MSADHKVAYMTLFRQAMRQKRIELKISQRDLARLTGSNRISISRYEMGHSEPSFSIAMAIAEVLNIEVRSLRG